MNTLLVTWTTRIRRAVEQFSGCHLPRAVCLALQDPRRASASRRILGRTWWRPSPSCCTYLCHCRLRHTWSSPRGESRSRNRRALDKESPRSNRLPRWETPGTGTRTWSDCKRRSWRRRLEVKKTNVWSRFKSNKCQMKTHKMKTHKLIRSFMNWYTIVSLQNLPVSVTFVFVICFHIGNVILYQLQIPPG